MAPCKQHCRRPPWLLNPLGHHSNHKKVTTVSLYTHITTELINTPTETQLTALLSLVTGLYKIISSKPYNSYLMSSNLVVVIWMSLPQYTEIVFSFSLLRALHAIHYKSFEYCQAWKSFQSLKLVLITLCCLLHLHQNFWLKMISFVAAEISTSQTFSLYNLWDK